MTHHQRKKKNGERKIVSRREDHSSHREGEVDVRVVDTTNNRGGVLGIGFRGGARK